MAGEAIFALRDEATHDGDTMSGSRMARIRATAVSKLDPGGADYFFTKDVVITDRDVRVEVMSDQHFSLDDFINAGAGDVVLPTLGSSGASETITVSDVEFSGFSGAIEGPAVDAGGQVMASGVVGYVAFASGEGFGDVISAA